MTNIAETTAFIGLLATASWYELRTYRRDVGQKARLGGIISGQLLQLDEDTSRLKFEIESRAVSTERERFTRDIHDGIGGQLLTLLLKARNGSLTPQQAETDVSSCIADLRLITAALDAGDDGLECALSSFADRARDQLDAADMTIEWHLGAGFDTIHTDPRHILELLRWLQEGLTNAIRHSGGTHVGIICTISEDQCHMDLRLHDNGHGYKLMDTQSGRGLVNMEQRATKLGGVFTMSCAPTADIRETVVALRIPLTSNGQLPHPQ